MKPLFALAAVTLLGGCGDLGDSSRFIQSDSPTQMGTAIFTKNVGLQDTGIDFSVRDPKFGTKEVKVGFVGDAAWKGAMPKQAAWSKDGSVVAVQSADAKSWSHSYDFRRGQAFRREDDDDGRTAKAIEKLLQSRGGIGPKVLGDWAKFDEVAQPVVENSR